MSSNCWAATIGVAVALMCSATGVSVAQEDAAAKAVEAAKQFAGSTITVVAEAGLQALLDTQYTGPEWEKLTGIKVKVVELPFEEIYPKTLLEKQAGTGGYDVVLISPAWLADMVANRCGRSRSIPISRNTASRASSTTSIRRSRTG